MTNKHLAIINQWKISQTREVDRNRDMKMSQKKGIKLRKQKVWH